MIDYEHVSNLGSEDEEGDVYFDDDEDDGYSQGGHNIGSWSEAIGGIPQTIESALFNFIKSARIISAISKNIMTGLDSINSTTLSSAPKIDFAKLPPFGDEDFKFSIYSEALQHVTSEEILDNVVRRFVSLKKPLDEVIGKDVYKFPFCQHGHSFMPEESSQGGCCDCGNPDSWKPSGFCKDHFLTDRPIHPSSLLDEPLKRKLHLIMRLITNHILALIQKHSEGQDLKHIKLFIDWLERISRHSYPGSHIISEEFSLQTLNPAAFNLHEPASLPYTSAEYGKAVDFESFLKPAFTKSAVRLILEQGISKLSILNATKTLLITLMGNRLFKIQFCEEFLRFYPDYSLSKDPEVGPIISSLNCQMFEIPSIIIPFSTGYSSKNILVEVINVFKKLIMEKSEYDLDDYTERAAYDKLIQGHQDFYYVVNYFKHVKISEYVYKTDSIIENQISILYEIQDMAPISRELHQAMAYELPIIGNIISIETQNIAAFSNFLQTLHKLNLSIHQPLGRIFGIFAINALYHAPDYSVAAIKSKVNMEALLYLANGIILPNVLLTQHKNLFWEKNLNINDFKSYYTWSLMWIDLFTAQYISVLIGPNYFLNLVISSFTSNFKYIENNPFVLPDLLKFIIQILQLRVSPKYSYQEARYHIIQGLIAKNKTHSALMSLRREFYSVDFIEEAIEEVSELKDKKLCLKPHLWDRFDYYYPYHYCEGDLLANASLNNYHEYLKTNKFPVPDAYPLPTVLEPLHPNLAAVNDLLDEPLLFDLCFTVLLPFVYNNNKAIAAAQPYKEYSLDTKFPLSDFINSPNFIPTSSDTVHTHLLDASANHVFYLMVMAIRTFVQTTFPTLAVFDQQAIRRSINSFFTEGNFTQLESSRKRNVSILCLLRPYRVRVASVDEQGLTSDVSHRSMNLLDLVSDFLAKMDTQNVHIEKKDLITTLLFTLNAFDEHFSTYFESRNLNIEDIINKQNEKEAKLKKEEALMHQRAIREKMMLQQQQFMRSNSLLMDLDDDDDDDYEDELDVEEHPTCVACKTSSRTVDNPLCAIGQVEGVGIRSSAMRQTIEEHIHKLPETLAVIASAEFDEVGSSFLVDSVDASVSPAALMRLFYECSSMNVRSCEHLIHRSCLQNFVGENASLTDSFKCPLCNRPSNLALAIDNVSATPQVLNPLFLSMMELDVTCHNEPTSFELSYIWRYSISNIETLEIQARSNTHYNNGVPYYVLSETDFQRRLKTLRLLYFNTIALSNLPKENADPASPGVILPISNVDLFQDDPEYSTFDPFMLASFQYYLNHHLNASDLIKRAYERMIFLSLASFENRQYDPSITLQTFSDIQHLRTTLGLRSVLECLKSPEYKEIGNFALLVNQKLIPYLPPVIPKFIEIPEIFINFLVEHIQKTYPNDHCCPYEILTHIHSCQGGIGIFLGVCNPTVTIYHNETLVGAANIYFDKFNEPSSKPKSGLQLNSSALRDLYISWMKSLFQEKGAIFRK
eukprot:gene5890-6814_t